MSSPRLVAKFTEGSPIHPKIDRLYWELIISAGASLVEAFKQSGAQYWPQTTVWSLNAQRQIGILRQGQASIIQAERVIIASGAMERPVPFPGWTLPGVMNVGAAQILLKTSGVVPASGTVIAGTGSVALVGGLAIPPGRGIREGHP